MMMAPPLMAPPVAMNPPPRPPQAAPWPAPPTFPAAPALAQGDLPPQTPRPIVRGQAPEEPAVPPTVAVASPVPEIPPAPPLLTLPAPEQLGIAKAPPTAGATADDLARLDHLGASCFRLDRTSAGYRVTCFVAGPVPNRQRRFEAEATTQAQALHLVLDRAEAWVAQK